jgi:hypothetical protein
MGDAEFEPNVIAAAVQSALTEQAVLVEQEMRDHTWRALPGTSGALTRASKWLPRSLPSRYLVPQVPSVSGFLKHGKRVVRAPNCGWGGTRICSPTLQRVDLFLSEWVR